MISSISPATKLQTVISTGTKKPVVNDETTIFSVKEKKPSVEIKGFSASTAEKVPNKFGTKETEAVQLIARAERDGEEALLKQLFSYIDREHHGLVGWGKDDGTIGLDNIKKTREHLESHDGETLGLQESSGRNLTTATVKRMLNYLEKVARQYGKEGDLNRTQLQNAFDAKNSDKLLYTPEVPTSTTQPQPESPIEREMRNMRRYEG